MGRVARREDVRYRDVEIAYEEHGPEDGSPVVLMHGFPDDVHAYDGVAPPLADLGWRVIVRYLRGYGPTRFRDPATLRSGQQGALGHNLLSLMDRLSIRRAVLVGYDWGGRAARIVAALWPERVAGLVSITGYNIQNIANAFPATCLAKLPPQRRDPGQVRLLIAAFLLHIEIREAPILTREGGFPEKSAPPL